MKRKQYDVPKGTTDKKNRDVTLTVKLERLGIDGGRAGAVMTFDMFVPANKVSAVKRFFRAGKGSADLFAVNSVK